MTTFLPKDLQDGLRAAQIASRKKASRLRVRAGDDEYPVLSLRADGFSVELDTVPPLRGLVDLYDGTRHLYSCLIVASGDEMGEMRYEFKRATQAQQNAPLDFYLPPDAPSGYIEDRRRS